MSTHETILNAMSFSRCASALQQRRSIDCTAAAAQVSCGVFGMEQMIGGAEKNSHEFKFGKFGAVRHPLKTRDCP